MVNNVSNARRTTLKEHGLKTDRSDEVMYCVPDTHWKVEMAGRAGMSSSGLKRTSSDGVLVRTR